MNTAVRSVPDVRQLTVGPLQENCYIISDRTSGDAVVVDPGYEAERILAALGAMEVRVQAIWLTHGHTDHVGAVAPLVDALEVPVYMHPADLPLFARAAQTGQLYGMRFDQPEAPDQSLSEGDSVYCGTLAFEVMHVPGHSPGQVAFVAPGLCFSGDLLFRGSIGRTDLPLSDPAAMPESLKRIAALPDDTVVFPGHGEVTTIGEEKLQNPFLMGLARPIRS